VQRFGESDEPGVLGPAEGELITVLGQEDRRGAACLGIGKRGLVGVDRRCERGRSCPQDPRDAIAAERVHERQRGRELVGSAEVGQRFRHPAGECRAPGFGDRVLDPLRAMSLPSGLVGADEPSVVQPLNDVVQRCGTDSGQPVMCPLADALPHGVRVQRLLGEQAEDDEGQRAAQLAWRHEFMLMHKYLISTI
jgi:hypothetical protein